jgi:hypothetical protein
LSKIALFFVFSSKNSAFLSPKWEIFSRFFDANGFSTVSTVCVSGGGAGVDKTPRAGFCSGVEKSPKMPHNPHRPLHALLARF